MSKQPQRVPAQAWVVTFAGMTVNLCLGVIYAWSVWKANLIGTAEHPAGSPMSGLNVGWTYLTDAEATWAYVICGMTFAIFMIPGGIIQDRFGPRLGATLSGLFLAIGCMIAGLSRSLVGLYFGFGLLGGIGMGLGYASTFPAAVRWFGAHQRGLVSGLVVSGYGAAAIYIAPLAKWLIAQYGISGSFIILGAFFAVVVILAGQLLRWPPTGYLPPALPNAPQANPRKATMSSIDWKPREMLGTWEFYALFALFFCSTQSGLLVIANATPILTKTASSVALLVEHGWLLASFGGIVNALGRVGTGYYSDKFGRLNAYRINAVLSIICLLLAPAVIASSHVPLLFLVVGMTLWQYGGGLSLSPALTADFFGPKHLGLNYGLVFLAWGLAFFVPQIAGYIKDITGSFDTAFYLSAALLAAAVVLSVFVKRPQSKHE